MKESKIIKKQYGYSGYGNRLSLLDVTYPQLDAKMPIVIFAHGFKGFKDWGGFPLVAEKFAENGFLFLKFNFSHNGGTVDIPIDFPDLEAFSMNTYSKELFDLNKVIDFASIELDSIVDRSKIYLIGHSRGGSISILAASNSRRVSKVVSWAAVDDFINRLPNEIELNEWKVNGFRNIFNSRTKQNMPVSYDFMHDLILNQHSLNIQKAQEKISIPQLIVNGEEDEIVKTQAAINLHHWNSSSKLLIIKNTGHTFGMKHPCDSLSLSLAAKELVNESISFLKD